MTRIPVGRWVACAAVAPILLLGAAPASAEERVCRGTIGATLRAEDVVVVGNVQAENARMVRVLDGSRVGRNVVDGNKEDQCARL
jgi:hypothetical protein